MFATKIKQGLLLISIILLSLLPAKVFAADSGAAATSKERIYGSNRYETAARIAEKGWQQSDYAILSAGMDKNLVDALTAAPLARVKDAPVLLTSGNNLDGYAKAQLQRLKVKTVYITSGLTVIQQPVLVELAALDITVISLGGSDRYETAINIARELKKNSDFNTAVVTTALSNADALTIAPIAAANGWPILLTSPDRIPVSTGQYINEEKITKTYVIGGSGAVANAVQKEMPNPIRIGGANRFDTNLKIIEYFKKQLDFSRGVYLANGMNQHLVDSLAGSSLIAQTSSPLILTDRMLSATVGSYLDANPEITKGIALGGEKAIDNSVLQKFQQTPSIEKYAEAGSVLGSSLPGQQKTYNGSVVLEGNGITLQNAVIKHDLFIRGKNCVLKNVTVYGKIYTNPEYVGNTVIDAVQTPKIVVQSYNDNGIHIDRNGKYGLTIYTKERSEGIHMDFEGYARSNNNSEPCAVIEFATGNGVGNIEVERVLGTQWRLTFAGTFNRPVLVDKMTYADFPQGIPEELKPDMPLEITTTGNSAVSSLEIWAEDNQQLNLKGRFADVNVHSKVNLVLEGQYDNLAVYSAAGISIINQSTLKNALIAGDATVSLTQKSKVDYMKLTGNSRLFLDAYTSVDKIDAAGSKSMMQGYGSVNGSTINSPEPFPIPGAAENTAVYFSVAPETGGTLYPIAGEDNPVTITILDRNRKTAIDISGVFLVTLSNIIKAEDGSYGSVNGTRITGSSYTSGITVPVNFVKGKGTINLVLSSGKGPSGDDGLQQVVGFKVNNLYYPNKQESLTFQVSGYRNYTQGKGTQEDPYIISTAQELNAIRYHVDEKDMYFKLGADIDLGIAPFNTGEGWVPLNASIKEFDGNGHVIKNLTINRRNADSQALFYRVELIKNAGLLNANVKGNKSVAGLVVYTEFVESCLVTGNISGSDRVGGIAGSVRAIRKSSARVDITGGNYTGGLVSSAYDISNSYVSGNITGKDYTGGLAGSVYAYLGGNAVNITAITASGPNTGRLVAVLDTWTNINNNIASSAMLYKTSVGDSGSTVFPGMPASVGLNSPGGADRSPALLSEQATYQELSNGWNFATTWTMVDGQPQLKNFIR